MKVTIFIVFIPITTIMTYMGDLPIILKERCVKTSPPLPPHKEKWGGWEVELRLQDCFCRETFMKISYWARMTNYLNVSDCSLFIYIYIFIIMFMWLTIGRHVVRAYANGRSPVKNNSYNNRSWYLFIWRNTKLVSHKINIWMISK